MKKQIVLAQLGCGYWGPNLLRNFSHQKNAWVKWVVETSESRRAFVQEQFPKSQVCAHFDQVLEDPEVDAVIIATNAASHFELTKKTLLAKKHAFVEKPLAMSTKEADELISIAKKYSLTLMVGHTFLYNSAVKYLKNLVDGGELGRIFYIYCQRLNLGQVRSDINVWWNLAPHDISILLYLKNGIKPLSVSAVGMDYIQQGIEDTAFVTLAWPDQTLAHIQVSWLDPNKVRKITLVGSQKMVVYDDISDDKISIFDKGVDKVPKAGTKMDYDHFNHYQLLHRQGDVLLPRVDFQEPLKVETSHFIDCVLNHKEPLTGAVHARDVVAILEAGQRALETKKTVFLNEDDFVSAVDAVNTTQTATA